MKPIKQARATTSDSNGPIVNLPDQQCKDMPILYQNLHILWQHYGLPDILSLSSSSNSMVI